MRAPDERLAVIWLAYKDWVKLFRRLSTSGLGCVKTPGGLTAIEEVVRSSHLSSQTRQRIQLRERTEET